MSHSGIFTRTFKVSEFKNKVEEYKKQCYNAGTIPTVNGLLLYLGMTMKHLQMIESGIVGRKNNKYHAVINAFQEVKFEYEYHLEQILIQQANHHVVAGNPKYNYNATVFLLRCSNPKKYGGGKYEVGGIPTPKTVEKYLIPKNESGVNLESNKNS